MMSRLASHCYASYILHVCYVLPITDYILLIAHYFLVCAVAILP